MTVEELDAQLSQDWWRAEAAKVDAIDAALREARDG